MIFRNIPIKHCMQDTFARATHSAYAAARPSARATIGYLVYNIKHCLGCYLEMYLLITVSDVF